jgi:DNA-binding PadR family transcriptional regulator
MTVSMKLVILGLLMEGECHPYEIRQKMIEREMNRFIKIKDGSLYYAIDMLKKDGWIEPVGTIRDSNRPEKTIYRITDAGRDGFQKLLLEQLEADAPFVHPMHTALPFVHHGDQRKIADVIERKLAQTKEWTERMMQVYQEHIPIVPRAVLHLMIAGYEHGLASVRWFERLLEDAKAGRLVERGKALEAYPQTETASADCKQEQEKS